MFKHCAFQSKNKRQKGNSMQMLAMQSSLKNILPEESEHETDRLLCWTHSEVTTFQPTKPMVRPACTFQLNLHSKLRLHNPPQGATPPPQVEKQAQLQIGSLWWISWTVSTHHLLPADTLFQYAHSQPNVKMGETWSTEPPNQNLKLLLHLLWK